MLLTLIIHVPGTPMCVRLFLVLSLPSGRRSRWWWSRLGKEARLSGGYGPGVRRPEAALRPLLVIPTMNGRV